jgi:hypothetical protein
MVLYANVCGVLKERLDGTTESVEIPDEEFRRLPASTTTRKVDIASRRSIESSPKIRKDSF